MTSVEPIERECPQESIVPPVVIGLNPAKIVGLFVVVNAAQCVGGHPLRPQQGWGLTLAPAVAIGRKLTSTVGSPDKITPPTALASPSLCTNPGIPYPIIIDGLRTVLIPVVASR